MQERHCSVENVAAALGGRCREQGAARRRGEPCVNRLEFQTLRDLPGKRITHDITFATRPDSGGNLVFDQVPVENELGWDVLLNGT